VLWFPNESYKNIFFLFDSKISNQRKTLLLSLWANAMILVGGSLRDVQRRCLRRSRQVSIFFAIACCLAERGFVPSVDLGECSAVRWVSICCWRTIRTCGIHRSLCKVWFVTYRGALVICRRIFAWYRWIITRLDDAAQPHSASPYVQIGFNTVL
jgi:hypothetical protein